MPYTFCVPNYTGNHKYGPKISAYKFSKNYVLQKKWVRANKRDQFTPYKNSRVGTELNLLMYIRSGRSYEMLRNISLHCVSRKEVQRTSGWQ